jgi:hypothetical protein
VFCGSSPKLQYPDEVATVTGDDYSASASVFAKLLSTMDYIGSDVPLAAAFGIDKKWKAQM